MFYPFGAADQAAKTQLHKDVNDTIARVLHVDGTFPNRAGDWVLIHEITEGNWDASGQTISVKDVYSIAQGSPERVDYFVSLLAAQKRMFEAYNYPVGAPGIGKEWWWLCSYSNPKWVENGSPGGWAVLNPLTIRKSIRIAISNYLFFTTTCEQALEFYAQCGLGQVTEVVRYGENDMPLPTEALRSKIMHAEFTGSGVLFFASYYFTKCLIQIEIFAGAQGLAPLQS